MKDIRPWVQETLRERLPKEGIGVDFTMGNGNDTLYMAGLVESGHIYAFDVQKQACETTTQLLEKHGVLDKVSVILDSHSNMDKYVGDQMIDVGVFNLGYLPRSDKSITTQYETTKEALDKALERLKIGGVIIMVIYPGHDEGAREAQLLYDFCKTLDRHIYNVLLYQFINKNNPPHIIAIEKYKTVINKRVGSPV
ncbi:MAG: class I SAM-dependent methyltransferase [Oscillospiraceae bacterium]|nr:class I SAM-dependent methyltransferase [Oscillospiraceae bacterium]